MSLDTAVWGCLDLTAHHPWLVASCSGLSGSGACNLPPGAWGWLRASMKDQVTVPAGSSLGSAGPERAERQATDPESDPLLGHPVTTNISQEFSVNCASQERLANMIEARKNAAYPWLPEPRRPASSCQGLSVIRSAVSACAFR